jgi:peroxiredoxin
VEDVGQDISRPATFVIDRAGQILYSHTGTRASDRAALDDILTTLDRNP